MGLSVAHKVEMALGYDWQDTSPVWTDVTAYVREAVFEYGRQRQLDRAEAGTCSLTLSNADRRFEPDYASGAYYPNIKLGVPVRIAPTVGVTTYPLWYGFVTSWPQDWPGVGGQDATVRVAAVDAFQFLARADVSAYAALVSGLAPFSYWRQQEEGGTSCADIGSDANSGTYVGSPTFSQVGPLAGEHYAVLYGAAKYVDIGAPVGAFDACDQWTFASWVYRSGVGEMIFRMDTNAYISIQVDASGKPVVYFDSPITLSGIQETVLAPDALTVSTWYHLAVTFLEDQCSIFVNGVPVKRQMANLTAAASLTENFRISAATSGWSGLMCEAALWNWPLDDGTIAQMAAATIATHPEETADARIVRILDEAGWPTGAAFRDLDVGVSTLTAIAAPSGTGLEQCLRAAMDSEMGYFYQAPDGKITFMNRASMSGGAAVASFDDADYTNLVIGYDDDALFTQVKVTLGDGTGQVIASDADAVAAYGPRCLERTADIGPSEALEMTQSLLARFKAPRLRVTAIEFQPESDSALYPVLFGLAVWEKVTVSRTPPAGGAAISSDYWVEGIRHELRPDGWKITLSCSPTGDTETWVLGTSELDYGTILGY